MTLRTTTRTVTFARPFVLGAFHEVQPAGDYIVETDEELLEGAISFPAYRRLTTVIYLHATPSHPGRMQALTTNPVELDAALMRDQAAAPTAADLP